MWPFNKKQQQQKTRRVAPRLGRNFVAAENDRLLHGWAVEDDSINDVLARQLPALKARAREQRKNNPYARRFVTLLKSNVLGPNGIQIQAQSKRADGTLDVPANAAIETAWNEWRERLADPRGLMTFQEMEDQALATITSDGEFIFMLSNTGRHGFQLRPVETTRLDIERNQTEANGNITVMGVEFNGVGRPVRYWFKKPRDQQRFGGRSAPVSASQVIHVFLHEWVAQARGIPWFTNSLFSLKMLDGYDEAAITAARAGANKRGWFITPDGQYVGDDEDAQGVPIDDTEPGEFGVLPQGYDVKNNDPSYPHDQYAPFIKSTLRRVSAGLDISYHSLVSDLESVNFSSARAGVLEDREVFKKIQNWLIIKFTKPVYEAWLRNALLRDQIVVGNRRPVPLARPVDEYKPARYQGRRWPWVDPLKDEQANDMALRNKTKSRSQIMREQGEDPETVWREIQSENEFMKSLGIDTQMPEGAANEQTQTEQEQDDQS